MLNRIKEGYDIVIGSRFINQKKEKSLKEVDNLINTFNFNPTLYNLLKDDNLI